jgi:hypothetical protein
MSSNAGGAPPSSPADPSLPSARVKSRMWLGAFISVCVLIVAFPFGAVVGFFVGLAQLPQLPSGRREDWQLVTLAETFGIVAVAAAVALLLLVGLLRQRQPGDGGFGRAVVTTTLIGGGGVLVCCGGHLFI